MLCETNDIECILCKPSYKALLVCPVTLWLIYTAYFDKLQCGSTAKQCITETTSAAMACTCRGSSCWKFVTIISRTQGKYLAHRTQESRSYPAPLPTFSTSQPFSYRPSPAYSSPAICKPISNPSI